MDFLDFFGFCLDFVVFFWIFGFFGLFWIFGFFEFV